MKMKMQIFRVLGFVVLVAAMAFNAAAQIPAEQIEEVRTKAEQGDAQAQVGLGAAYAFGLGVAKDQREAVRWYRKAAEQGNVRAQNELGIAYNKGKGIAKDQREAVRWYRKAAEQGLADAQLNLGHSYLLGEGVTTDKRKAAFWYRKAAEQGNTDAQSLLGGAYYEGRGVVQDKREAVRWWHKAAEQGDAIAQALLGRSYLLGEGVIEDDREAYIWLSIAKANGSEEAGAILSDPFWRKTLSKSEIRSAQKEAAQRLETIENRQENSADTPAIGTNTTITATPKQANIAEKVFENAWRSVVVVVNGDNQGSGVIIRPNIVATNCHVVDASGIIAVYKSDDRRADTDTAFSATIHRSDEERDFCLLDVDGLWGVPATVRRYDTLKVGEDVYGLGAPKGLDLSLSDGLVSQLREVRGYRVIQTNVAISPGSSGGGLFDGEGNLVGIMTEKIVDESTEGIGFAIPADLVFTQ